MDNQRNFRVALRGFSKFDAEIIYRICKLTLHRTRCYTLTSGRQYDIILADGLRIHADDVETGNPIVWIGGETADQPFHMSRPILSSRLLRILDKVTVSAFNYIPEIEIGVKTTNDRESLTKDGFTDWRFDKEDKLRRYNAAFAY